MSSFLRTDVTALKLHENLVFAGIGCSVNIFNKCRCNFLQRILCLKGQKVYGLVPSRDGQEIVVFGGKQFTVLKCDGDGVYIKLFEAILCDDWLHSAVWTGDNSIAVLTAHNVIQEWLLSPPKLKSRHGSADNSILYSGLLLRLQHEVLAMAGTVFSEVIIHCKGNTLQTLKGHKGVIFSISCKNEIVVTTSDDRSVRIWGPNIPSPHSPTSFQYWTNVDIVCRHELYGHLARVMKSCISSRCIVSVGEDSATCFWSFEGTLLKKTCHHQGGSIWSADADDEVIVTGGGDGGIIVHPITSVNAIKTEVLNIDDPKKVLLTSRNNIVVLNDNDELIHFNVEEKSQTKHKLLHDSTYKLISLSSCKQLLAVTDMNGKLDIFIENCKETAFLIKIVDMKLDIGKVLSMNWAGNRHLVLCSNSGEITVLTANKSIEYVDGFLLPHCKERWLTATAFNSDIFVFGDRCGNIHVYKKGSKLPVQTFRQVHGRYGPTSIKIRNNEILTTGRDGSVKYFNIDNGVITFAYSKDMDFQWVEKLLDHKESLICGFQERIFVVHNLINNSKVVEVPCGGGHRSWDAARFFSKISNKQEEVIKFIYLKNNEIIINTFVLSEIVSRSLVNGSHCKEINCLKCINFDKNILFISGSEDTTLRISCLKEQFEDKIIFKHLSNVRTLKTYILNDGTILVVSGGGRAQICAKVIKIQSKTEDLVIKSQQIADYMIKGTDKNRKNNQDWRKSSVDFDPETRIMDLDILKTDDQFKIYSGCSDSCLRVFSLNLKTKSIEIAQEIKYHKTCILKTHILKYYKDILISTTTRGDMALWNLEGNLVEPIFETKTNKSGINSVATRVKENNLFIATAGDDNAIHFVVTTLKNPDSLSSLFVKTSLVLDKYHSSQITGLLLLDDYLISASIDQRITLFRWRFDITLECEFISQSYSDVADIQGMDLLEQTRSSIKVCVFGQGVEIIEIQLPEQ